MIFITNKWRDKMTKYAKDYQVKYFDVDAQNKLKLSNLMDLLLETSNEQTVQLGVSAADLLEQNLGWVVTQYHIEINALPKLNQKITLQTKATGYNRFFCYRDFWVLDEQGQELIYVRSIWITLNLTTRKLEPLSSDISQKIGAPEVKKVQKFPRIKFTDLTTPSQPYRVRYYDLDGNHHVNNSHYFEWMIDTIPVDFLTTHQLQQIDIKFENEVLYGDQPKSSVEIQADESISFHQIINNKNKAAEAIFTWQK